MLSKIEKLVGRRPTRLVQHKKRLLDSRLKVTEQGARRKLCKIQAVEIGHKVDRLAIRAETEFEVRGHRKRHHRMKEVEVPLWDGPIGNFMQVKTRIDKEGGVLDARFVADFATFAGYGRADFRKGARLHA